MGESGAASHDADLLSVAGRALEQFGVTDALTLAEAVALYRDHLRWAVWLPAPGGGWADWAANPPLRTRRRSPDGEGSSAVKYREPFRGEPSRGHFAPSSLPVSLSRRPHRRDTEP